jgi:hypothetical protein
MPDLPTRLDLHQLGRQYLLARARRIDPVIVDTEGSDANLFVGSQAGVDYSIVQQLADRLGALLLDSAEGEDLERWGWDRYRLPKKGAGVATAQVRFFRPTAAAGAGSFPIGTKLSTLTRAEYLTTQQADFGVTTLETTVFARAVRAGKDVQVGANQIRRISASSFDPTIQVTNDAPSAGGEPREGDDDYRLRIRQYWLNVRRGTLSAIAYGATTVSGVVSSDAIEEIGQDGNPARLVMLYIADSSGIASRPLANAVDQALLEWRAGGITVVIGTSLPQIVPIKLKLSFRANIDTAALREIVRATIVGYVNSLQVNQPMFRNMLGGVMSRFQSSGLLPDQSSVSEPAGDLYPTTGRTLRTRLEHVTFE